MSDDPHARAQRLDIECDLVEPDAILALARNEFERTVAVEGFAHLGFDEFCGLLFGKLSDGVHDVFETVVVPATGTSPVVLRILLSDGFKFAVAQAAERVRHESSLSLLSGSTAKPEGGVSSRRAPEGCDVIDGEASLSSAGSVAA